MGRVCAVRGCGKIPGRRSCHRLPLRNSSRLKLWLTFLGFDADTPISVLQEADRRVCAMHFRHEDYVQSTRNPKRVQSPKKLHLRRTAVPTLLGPGQDEEDIGVLDGQLSSPQSVSSTTGPSSPVATPTIAAASDAESPPSLPPATVKEEGSSAAVCGAVWNSHTHTGSNNTPLTHTHEREHTYAEGRSTPFLRSEKISLQEEVTVQVSCLLQLFDRCLGCSAGSCSVLTRRDGRVFHVTQQCWTCQIIVEWNSHTADSSTANKLQEGGGEGGVVEIKEEIQVQEEEQREEERGEEQISLDTLEEEEEDSGDEDEEDEGGEEGLSGTRRGRKRRRMHINEDDEEGDGDEEYEEGEEEEEEEVLWQKKAKKRTEEIDQDWAPEDDQMLPESERPSSCSEESGDDDDDEGVDDELWERELCSDCGKMFRKRPDKRHVCLHKAKPVECHICGKRCLNEQGLSVHIAHCHDRGPQCKYCNKTLRSAKEKLHHEETSHGDEEGPKFRCPDCSERFHDYESRAAHRKTAHPPNTTCPFCDRKFKNECRLKRHKLIHTGRKPFGCRMCERSFNQRGHLKSHMRLHTGERPFKCPQCERSFNHNVSLKNHLQRHHGAKTGPSQQEQQEASGTQQEGSRTDQSSGTSEQTLLSRPEADPSQNSITCSRTDQSSGTLEKA